MVLGSSDPPRLLIRRRVKDRGYHTAVGQFFNRLLPRGHRQIILLPVAVGCFIAPGSRLRIAVRRSDAERSHRVIAFPQAQGSKKQAALSDVTLAGLRFACSVDLTAYQMNGNKERKDLTRRRVTETRTMAQSLWLL